MCTSLLFALHSDQHHVKVSVRLLAHRLAVPSGSRLPGLSINLCGSIIDNNVYICRRNTPGGDDRYIPTLLLSLVDCTRYSNVSIAAYKSEEMERLRDSRCKSSFLLAGIF